MLLGPVFRAELLRTARRRRYYVARFVYGLLLFFIIWIGYESAAAVSSILTIKQVAAFAEETFVRFAVVQLITILLLIPALFGGAIADEKQRKTLHYLMASRLSSFEIVSDKVLGRMPHLAVFLAMGLPVVCLLGLFGGVSMDEVAVAYVGTISTASFAVALTVLVSTLARKVRQAVLVAYVLMLGWQFVPVIVERFGSHLYPQTYGWIEPVFSWVAASCPLGIYVSATMRRGFGGMRGFGGPGAWSLIEQVAWMVGLQLVGAALMILLAVVRLRPTFRRHAEARPRRSWFGNPEGRKSRVRRRWWDRPECGEDAMGWKERYFIRSDAFTRMAVLPGTVLVSVFLILAVGVDETIPRAFADLWRQGFRAGWSGEQLVDQLRIASAWYVAIWLLAVAGASASSVAVEREEDTWISLISTPLTAREILRGKILGAIWGQRGFAAIPVGLWAIGLVTGSVHPLGFLGALLMFGLATWLVAAVGVHASVRSTSTSKALTSTIVTLAVLSGYPLFLLASFLEYGGWERYTALVGLPARLAVGPLVTYAYFSEVWGTMAGGGFRQLTFANFIAAGLILALLDTLVAATLTLRTLARFDAWLDRPRITLENPAAGRKSRPVEEIEPALQS